MNRKIQGEAFSTGWVGVDVVYRQSRVSASHTIVRVENDSPAFRAGLMVGDQIWGIGSENTAWLTVSQVADKLSQAEPPLEVKVKRAGSDRLLSFTLTRDARQTVQQMKTPPELSSRGIRSAPQRQVSAEDATSERQSIRRARMRSLTPDQAQALGGMANAPITDPYEIPGLAPRDATATGINELQRVYLDPASGRLVFVGTYNEHYATGAIDYSALLNDALNSPAPFFSLEPTPQSKRAIADFAVVLDQQMQRNLSSVDAGKAWLTRIFDLLLSDPTLGNDRRRFFKKGAEILKCKPEDMPDMTRALLGRVHKGTPAFTKFGTIFYQSQGNWQFATFMQMTSGDNVDPQTVVDALDVMGLEPLRQELRNKVQAGYMTNEQGEFVLQVGIWEFNFTTMHVPEYRWKSAFDRAKVTYDETAFRQVLDTLNAELFTERVMEPWLNGMIFSEQFLHRMFNLPPIETTLVCQDGLDPNSELARTFLEADWYLKTLSGEPELAEKVPGHLTRDQFLFQRESATGQYNTNGVEGRFWLQPEAAPLAYNADNTVVSFSTPEISINAELLSLPGGSAALSAMVQSGLKDYGQSITRRYEAYAKALPPLHRLREAAKILALVNWARRQGIALQPPEPPAAPVALPSRFTRGFWTAQFVSQNDRTFIGYSAEGGVDFSQNVGSDWIETREDDTLGRSALDQLATSAALGQQAVDAALNGDLDAARTLADQSALAMTGAYDFSANPALPEIPEASPPMPLFEVELQRENLKQTTQAVEILTRSSDPQEREQATQTLQQIQTRTPASTPAPVHSVAPVTHTVSVPLPVVQMPPAPQPVVPPVVAAKPTVTPVVKLAEPAEEAIDEELIALEKERILGEITDLRKDLCRIQTRLRRFNATIQADQAQRQEWETTVDKAYDRALDRAKNKVADFTLDFPESLLKERLDSLTDPAERQKVEQALRMLQHLKEAYEVKDFSEWAANEHFSKKEVMAGIKQIVSLIGLDSKIKGYLVKRWGLGRVLAFKAAADDLIESSYDVTAEVVSWQRLAQLNRNSEAFLKAVDALARHQREVMEQIHARELRLGLKPGATRDPCP